MSGDVQPKKRKDKRKKKEDHQEDIHQPTTPTPPTLSTDDTNIHIHKEKTVGGGICAKCIFFIITLAIAIVLGFTIVEHRGLTDIDIPLSESRFAAIFEGWIDTSPDHDDHHDEVALDDHDDHDDEEEDEGIGSEEEEEHEESEEAEAEDEQEDEESEQEQDDSEVEQEESEELDEEIDEPEDEEVESPEIQAESDEQDEEEEQDDDQDEDDDQQVESEEEQTEVSEEQEEQEDEEEGVEGSEEQPEASEEDDEQKNVSEENAQGSEENQNDISNEDKDDNQDGDDNDIEDATNGANTGMAAKVSVGVALLIVAYVVLIKKWKTERTENPSKQEDAHQKEDATNLSRRNTIVPPPTLEEIEQDLENQEEYSEEEEEEEESDTEIHVPASKKHYEELRATYTRTLSPGSKEREEEFEDDEDVDEEEEEEYDDRDEEEYEEEDEDDDEELMKKLEEKYGKLNTKSKYVEEEEEEEEVEEEDEDIEDDGGWKRVQESESDDEKQVKKRTSAQAYEFENITNSEDYLIRDSLETAERHLPNNLPLALNLFIQILEDHPGSPRALYGRARTLDQLAEKKRSNEILRESIKYFTKVLNAKHVPDALFLAAAKRCIERMRFIGNYAKSIEIHQKLLEKFPDDIKHRNDFAVTLLTINKIATARALLLETLKRWPEDGFALVHYGFILKTVDNNLSLAIEYLTKGISTKEPGVVDGRFYFHLGDALARIGKPEEAIKIYEDGVVNKVFLSKYQRSLYNVNRLTGKPFWEPEETPYDNLYELLRQNWKEIRNEGLSMLDKKGYFKDESENLKDVGDWKQFELYARGVKNTENCLKCPITCQIIESSSEAKTCRRGQVKFSVMHPGTHVWPHCGPTNCRLRVHLGLKVPPKTYIRVAEEIRSWEEGKIIVFDDSFEHEVWHNGTEYRLVLIVDVWHPELTIPERVNLSPI